LDIHCIADNYANHNHPRFKAWQSARPRWHMHYMPPYSSWLKQVERFFFGYHRQGYTPWLVHQRRATRAMYRPFRRRAQRELADRKSNRMRASMSRVLAA
jgi:hypothetical protein